MAINGSQLPYDKGELPYPGLKTPFSGTLTQAGNLTFRALSAIWLCVDLGQITQPHSDVGSLSIKWGNKAHLGEVSVRLT